MFKTAYKIEADGSLKKGSYLSIPEGFTEYTVGQEPAELKPFLDADILSKKINLFTNYVNDLIIAEIEAYNKASGTVFSSPEGVEKFNKAGASHYAFANSLSNWIVSDDPLVGIWKKARKIQADVVSGLITEPTREEFIAMLPKRV